MGVAYITSLSHIHGTPTGKASEALRLGVSGQNILNLIIAPPAVRRVIF